MCFIEISKYHVGNPKYYVGFSKCYFVFSMFYTERPVGHIAPRKAESRHAGTYPARSRKENFFRK